MPLSIEAAHHASDHAVVDRHHFRSYLSDTSGLGNAARGTGMQTSADSPAARLRVSIGWPVLSVHAVLAPRPLLQPAPPYFAACRRRCRYCTIAWVPGSCLQSSSCPLRDKPQSMQETRQPLLDTAFKRGGSMEAQHQPLLDSPPRADNFSAPLAASVARPESFRSSIHDSEISGLPMRSASSTSKSGKGRRGTDVSNDGSTAISVASSIQRKR